MTRLAYCPWPNGVSIAVTEVCVDLPDLDGRWASIPVTERCSRMSAQYWIVKACYVHLLPQRDNSPPPSLLRGLSKHLNRLNPRHILFWRLAQWNCPMAFCVFIYKLLKVNWTWHFDSLLPVKVSQVKSIQRHFTKQVISRSTTLSFKEVCSVFKREPLSVSRLKINLDFTYTDK